VLGVPIDIAFDVLPQSVYKQKRTTTLKGNVGVVALAALSIVLSSPVRRCSGHVTRCGQERRSDTVQVPADFPKPGDIGIRLLDAANRVPAGSGSAKYLSERRYARRKKASGTATEMKNGDQEREG